MNRPLKSARLSDRIAYAVATGAGAGFLPVAPGTFGAIEAVGIFLLTGAVMRDLPREHLALLALMNVLIFVVGVWASGCACRLSELEDPSQVVIDEVNGQLIALSPLALRPTAAGVVAAFVLFRLFDIFKPYPIRNLEHWRAGLGVMADDALAGIYAAVLIGLAMYMRLL